jgi:ppGpp synthetase/RelA/SpoT-type nucleotidyltranferase
MQWIEPQFSKEKIKKAGKALVVVELKSKEFKEAAKVFHNWRSAHAFPMQIMLDLLRKNAIRIDRKALVVQRLKRVSSIFHKIVREKNMSLSRMEDIAGCRAVVDNVNYVNRVYNSLKISRTKNILSRERNYIANPKESGYRGIHLVFRYKGSKKKYHGMSVELQIRSKIQHSWATAVEVVGTFTKQALKASSGEAIWLDFFKYVSVEFAKLEKSFVDSRYENVDTFSKMDQCIRQLDLSERLKAFKVAAKALSQDKGKGLGYFVILLDISDKVVHLTRFGKQHLSSATSFYDEQEEKYRNDTNKDVVLVSAGSVRDLKRAYPNYFADTDDFEKNIHQVYAANNKMHPTAEGID